MKRQHEFRERGFKLLASSLLLLGVLLLPTSSFAQFTTVTGTVTDPNGIPYVSGTIAVNLVTGAACNNPTLNGASFANAPGPFQMDTTGSFTFRLPDVTVISPAGCQWAFTVNESPGILPPQGFGAVSFTFTSTGTLISGSSVSISSNLSALAPALSRSAGGNILGNTVTVATSCPSGTLNISCFKVFADVVETPNVAQVWDVVTTIGGSNVSCGLSDCNFLASDVNTKFIQAVTNCFSATATVVIAKTLITGFTDANHISISPATAITSQTTACAKYGHDDTTALRSAWAVCTTNITTKPCSLNLPAGNMFFQKALFVDNAHNNRQNAYSVIGAGADTVLIPTTDFDTTTCAQGNGSFGNAGNGIDSFAIWESNSNNGGINSAVPNVDVLKDFTVDGMDIPGNTAGGTGFCGMIAMQRGEIYNVHLWDWMYGGASAARGIRLVGPVEVHGLTSNNNGAIMCLGQGSNNSTITMEQSYCTGGVNCLDLTGSMFSYGSFYGPCTAQVINVHSGNMTSYGDIIQPLGTFGLKVGDTATAFFNCDASVLGAATDAGAPSIYVYSVGTFNIGQGCVLQHAAAGQQFGGVAGGIVTNASVNNVPLGTFVTAGINSYVDLTGTFTGAGCTGVATSSTTLGLYGTGPNVTATTCTSAAIGSGIRINRPAHIYELLVTSTTTGSTAASGTVTVLKNGAGQTMSCIVGNVTTGCSDSTAAHFVTLAAGDLVSLNFTTGAGETLANVQVTLVIW